MLKKWNFIKILTDMQNVKKFTRQNFVRQNHENFKTHQIATKKFTQRNHILTLGNYTLVYFTPGINLVRVSISTKVEFTLGNLILSLGIYFLVKLSPGNPTKGNLPRVFISSQVNFTWVTLSLPWVVINLPQVTPRVILTWVIVCTLGNLTLDNLTLENITLKNLTLGNYILINFTLGNHMLSTHILRHKYCMFSLKH